MLVLNATDGDLTQENSEIHYRISRPMEGFTIHAIYGILSVNRTALLKPVPKEIQLTVIAEDSGIPPLNTVCCIVFRLAVSTCLSPEIEYRLLIKENSLKGTSLMELIEVGLLDGIIMYEPGNKIFEVSGGKIILVEKLDRETKDR